LAEVGVVDRRYTIFLGPNGAAGRMNRWTVVESRPVTYAGIAL
jgi:hypothetical protein